MDKFVNNLRGALRFHQFPITLFFINRGFLVLVAYFSLSQMPINSAPWIWRGTPQNLLVDGWTRWDAGWYRDIVENGYTTTSNSVQSQLNVAFFPAFPYLLKLICPIFNNHTFYVGFVFNHVCFLLALIILYDLVRKKFSVELAQKTTISLAFFPFSLFFSAFYTESLFLLATITAFYLAERQRWYFAGLMAALAGATRVVGIFTGIALFFLYLDAIKYNWRNIRLNIIGVCLCILGPLSYMCFLFIKFGDPLIFLRAQSAPGWVHSLGVNHFLGWLNNVSFSNFEKGYIPIAETLHIISVIGMGILLILGMLGIKNENRIPYPYLIFGGGVFLFSLTAWTGFGRFSSVIFPAFIVLAMLFSSERKFFYFTTCCSMLLTLETVVFTHFYWVA